MRHISRIGLYAFRRFAQLTFCTLVVLSANAQPLTGQHYELELRPDFKAGVLHGRARIRLQAEPGSGDVLVLRSPKLHIHRASLDGEPRPLEQARGGWRIPLTNAQTKASSLMLELDYHAEAAAGLVFGEDYVYTAFFTCHWMPCAGPDLSRATIAIRLELPAGYRSVASGQLATEGTPGRHEWQQTQPYPLYTLGFTAGHFNEVVDSEKAPRLRFLGIDQADTALRAKFKESARVLSFFEDKAGLPLPHPTYTQVLVPGGVAQEASSFSLIGTRMLDPILDDPKEDWVIAHEMAHQWWGNLITCATWSDFWLNEGLTVFMTAAWKQHRWGEDAYQREMVLAQQRWQSAKEADFDKPLSWPGNYPSLKSKRAIHYSKGALFFDTLRGELGEQAFWDGLRRYTRNNAGRSVRAADLQVAMEASAGRSLQTLFDAWVY